MPSCLMMEVKVTDKQYRREASDYSCDLRHVLDRRAKVKVSSLMSPECQLAILMAQEDTHNRQPTREEADVQPVTSAPSEQTDISQCGGDDDVSEGAKVRFSTELERLPSARLYGDITDTSFTPKQSRKRALRAGERVHTAMEVVEIVRHEDCSQHTDSHSHYDDTDDEQEATRRNADLNSLELCRAWVQLHFHTDDGSSCDVKNDR